MKKGLLIAGVLLLATSATAAVAQVPGYGWGGYGFGGPHSYAEYARQLRACRQHARLHRELDEEHAMEHAQGLEGPGDHYDLHDSLDEAHDAYHQDHPRADLCDAIGNGAPYRVNPYGYGNYPYGYGSDPYSYGYAPYAYGYEPGRAGMSFSFGFGR